MLIAVQKEDFDFNQLYRYLEQSKPEVGAIVTFTGLVRDFHKVDNDDTSDVSALTLEHYPGMTEKCLVEIAEQAKSQWQLNDLIILHRIGTLYPGDNIVFVACASAHRKDAFAACQFMMDILKTSAPFWKKEQTSKGARWVESKQSDAKAADKWLK